MNMVTQGNTPFALRSVLVQAEQLSALGRYPEAIRELEVLKSVKSDHSDFWASIVAAKQARIYLRTEQLDEARACISLVNVKHRETNPQLDALCLTVEAFLEKFAGWNAWKQGNIDRAVLKTLNAIDVFSEARDAATFSEDVLIQR